MPAFPRACTTCCTGRAKQWTPCWRTRWCVRFRLSGRVRWRSTCTRRVTMPDTNVEKSVEAIMGSAFGAAGERCLAGSVLVAVGESAAAPGTEMGPLITAEHRARVVGYIEKGVAEGAQLLVDGRARMSGDHGGYSAGYFMGPLFSIMWRLA